MNDQQHPGPTFAQTHAKPAMPVRLPESINWNGSNLITLISTDPGWLVKLSALDRTTFFVDGKPFLGNIKTAGAVFRLCDIPDELMRVYIYGEENLMAKLEEQSGRRVYPTEMVTVVQFMLDEAHMRSFRKHYQNEVRDEKTRDEAEALKAKAKADQQKVLIIKP